MINKCIFIGNMGQDPEIRTTGDSKVANFSIGVNKTWKDKNGEKQTRTEWVRCTAWRQLAEIAEKWLRKGQQVYVEGELETRSYEKDGQTHYTTAINLETIKILGFKKDDAAQPAATNQGPVDTGLRRPSQERQPATTGGDLSQEEDDLPF